MNRDTALFVVECEMSFIVLVYGTVHSVVLSMGGIEKKESVRILIFSYQRVLCVAWLFRF
jgi:hypothetical protein